MMDYYSSCQAPDFTFRLTQITQQVMGHEKNLQAFDEIVRKAVEDTFPGSLTGWNVYGMKEATEKAKIRLTLYRENLEKRVRIIFSTYIMIVKQQRAFRSRAWSIGGALYTKLCGTTLVGKLETSASR